VARFASNVPVYSGHNALHGEARPPDHTRTVVMVGEQLVALRHLFATCRVVDRLDNGVGVENEEQGVPVALCADPVRPWGGLWPEFRHLD
jgi:hypothetical protein